MSVSSAANSYDEWSSVREIIVGTAEGIKYHHIDATFALFYFENIYTPVRKLRTGTSPHDSYLPLSSQLVEELEEDVEELVTAIRTFGATVLRPAPVPDNPDITTPYWSSRAIPALNVRDQTMVLGNTIVDTAPHVRARIFENDLLKPILYEYFKRGANWISMPRPTLARGTLDAAYFTDSGYDVESALAADESVGIAGLGREIVFDGAQCIRLGKDVLVNVANENHELGYVWLQRTLGDTFRFHKMYRLADNHVDSILLPLRPGTLLLRSPEYLPFLPSKMRSWEIIYPPEVEEARFPVYDGDIFYIASKYIDMNVLSLDENTVVVNALYPELIRHLERRGFTVVPVRHRHRRLFGGGFHCFTLDCVRTGGLSSYLD